MPKTPISYFGGKQNMLKHILPLIPKQYSIYTEAFFGGGAVFFALKPVQSEIINDINGMVIDFYRVCKTDFDWLKASIEATLFARDTHDDAWHVYRKPYLADLRKRSWAFYVATNMGFACQVSSWGYDKYGKRVKSFRNKKMRFNDDILERLENVQVENNDACKVITSRDAEDAFHYVDPPYVSDGSIPKVHQGHYAGYTLQDYKRLLDTLAQVKGKFLLSSYPSKLLDEYIKKYGWYTKKFDKPLSAQKAKNGEKRKRKVEVLTANYPIT